VKLAKQGFYDNTPFHRVIAGFMAQGGDPTGTGGGGSDLPDLKAEFTPTPIQTREERADLVYAIKIRVANANGVLKIGMPVDVTFGPAGPAK
jgi:cyclophilin family peptidyl-prolyl cis-trans isomerase